METPKKNDYNKEEKSRRGWVKWYQENIIDMVEHINSVWMLKQIYRFILSLGK